MAELPLETDWIWLIENFTYVLGNLARGLCKTESRCGYLKLIYC